MLIVVLVLALVLATLLPSVSAKAIKLVIKHITFICVSIWKSKLPSTTWITIHNVTFILSTVIVLNDPLFPVVHYDPSTFFLASD